MGIRVRRHTGEGRQCTQGICRLQTYLMAPRDPDCPVCITFKLNHHKSLPVPEAAWMEDSGWDHANYCPQGGGSRS